MPSYAHIRYVAGVLFYEKLQDERIKSPNQPQRQEKAKKKTTKTKYRVFKKRKSSH